jgi:hypothetical protein
MSLFSSSPDIQARYFQSFRNAWKLVVSSYFSIASFSRCLRSCGWRHPQRPSNIQWSHFRVHESRSCQRCSSLRWYFRMPPTRYVTKILSPSTWGGAIELGILASYFSTEIASIDVETGRIDFFSPVDVGARRMRCVLIYSGIHYDAATLAPAADAPSEWHQTLFPIVCFLIFLNLGRQIADNGACSNHRQRTMQCSSLQRSWLIF